MGLIVNQAASAESSMMGIRAAFEDRHVRVEWHLKKLT